MKKITSIFIVLAGLICAGLGAGADKPISGLSSYVGQPGTNDLIPFVNRANVTQSTNGSTMSMTWSNVVWSMSQYPAQTLVLTNGAKIIPGGGGRLSVYDTNGNAMINIAPYSYTEVKYTDATSGDSLGVRINTNGFNITGTVGYTTYSGGFSNNQWYGSFNTNSTVGTNVLNDIISFGSRWRTIYQTGPFRVTPVTVTASTNLIATVPVPPLRSPYAQLFISHFASRTNATAQCIWTVEIRANATNGTIVASYQILNSGTIFTSTQTASAAGVLIPFLNCNSYTNQTVAGNNSITATAPTELGWNTQASTNVLYVMLSSSSAVGAAPLNFNNLLIVARE